MVITTNTMTGHLARFQTVTAVPWMPNSFPTCSASGPLTTTAIELTATSRSSTRVITICRGLSFQKGRPSSIS